MYKQRKKISFIVPVYNSEQYLQQCIESVIYQTYSNWELILINDGSTDKSEMICKKYEKKDSRIIYLYKENGGVSSARNAGIEKATGEYICFIDSDDYIDACFSEMIVDKMSDNTSMVVFGLTRFKNDFSDQKVISYRLEGGRYELSAIMSSLIDDGTLSGFTFHSSCSALFRRKLIIEKKLRFNEILKYNEDGLFVSEYLMNCDMECIYVDFKSAPYYYRENEMSATHLIDLDKYESDMNLIESILDKYSDRNNVKEQILKRRATVTFDILLLLNQPTIKRIRTLFSRRDIVEAFKTIRMQDLNRKKRIAYLLIRLRMYGLIKCMLFLKNNIRI